MIVETQIADAVARANPEFSKRPRKPLAPPGKLLIRKLMVATHHTRFVSIEIDRPM